MHVKLACLANFWHFLSDLLQNDAINESIQWIMILFLNSKMNHDLTILENLRIVPIPGFTLSILTASKARKFYQAFRETF